jgi:peptide deformylase
VSARRILALPNPTLKRVADALGGPDAALAQVLVDTMRVSPGCVGLAAPQIGVSARAFCLDVSSHQKGRPNHGLVVLFDPALVATFGAEVRREGCMSVPDLTGDVRRAGRVVVRGLTQDGLDRVLEVDAFEARAVLHELDHLDGRLFLDRVAAADRVFPRRVYR